MKQRSDAWFATQEAHCARALAEVDRTHTPEEIAAARAALAVSPAVPQQTLFAPPHTGLIPGGQPEPSGLADRDPLGA